MCMNREWGQEKTGTKKITILEEYWISEVHDIYLPELLSNNSWKMWHLHLNVRCTKIPALQPSLPPGDQVCVHLTSIRTSNPSLPLWFLEVLRNLLNPNGNYTYHLVSQREVVQFPKGYQLLESSDLWPQVYKLYQAWPSSAKTKLASPKLILHQKIFCVYTERLMQRLVLNVCICFHFLNLFSWLRTVFMDFMIQFS